MALSDRISAFIEQRMAMEAAAALEVEEAEQYQQYQDDAPPHSAQRQVTALCCGVVALHPRVGQPATGAWPGPGNNECCMPDSQSFYFSC
jgi:hypothetical protein